MHKKTFFRPIEETRNSCYSCSSSRKSTRTKPTAAKMHVKRLQRTSNSKISEKKNFKTKRALSCIFESQPKNTNAKISKTTKREN